jgi:glycosyltransferase involved in cell wall biosynthesis
MRRLLEAVPRSRTARPAAMGRDAAWLSPDLFRVAQVHFDLHRRPLRLRLPDPPALMHWTYPLPLVLPGVPNLVTVHDLIPLLRPELTGIRPGRMERLLRAVIAQAACVVTVSETVRADIVRRLDVAPERVVNLFQAVDLPPALLAASDAAADPCPSGSFVCVGSVEPRKNVGRLIAAHGLSGSRRILVLIGPDGAGAAGELTALAGHPCPERVLRLPWTAQPQLVRALRAARAVLFPSLAEGFGLPIAEAMTLGVPVLTARGGATEEIAGGAALLADPLDVAELAQAIGRLDRDDTLCAGLVAAGRDRATLFSVEAYGLRLDELYRRVMAASLSASPRIT